jgi:hypothetical protein
VSSVGTGRQARRERVPLADLASAALVELALRKGVTGEAVEAISLRQSGARGGFDPSAFAGPVPLEDQAIATIAAFLGLGSVEQLTLGLLVALEEDQQLAAMVSALQAPATGSRPMVGLLAMAFAAAADVRRTAFEELVDGPARAAGAFILRGDEQPLAERRLALPPPVHAALRGLSGPVPGVTLPAQAPVPLPPSLLEAAARHAAAFSAQERTLLIRTPSPTEGRAACAAVAAALDGQVVFVEGDPAAGLGLWLTLCGHVPVFAYDLGPNDRRRLPALPGYLGPVLVLAGPDGAVEHEGLAVPDWRLVVPTRDERQVLWQTGLQDPALAEALAIHRHGAGRIAQVSRAARRAARLEGASAVERRHVRAAAWTSEGAGLRGLAEPLADDVPAHALVTTPTLRRELELLLMRCRARDRLGERLGPAIRARHRPGVRALFVGPSGTGKTFAASWLASRLEAPIYRVDLAAVSSKYIGETEKNLGQLLSQAEHEEIALLFDEADSMFGKRTDVKDANDRFANAQTNFLLQRIESFDGLVILTSNSRSRIDAAFTRRLDAVVEFPAPGPEERRMLWRAHLGDDHELLPADFNRLAAVCDLVGGHIRNAVLCASLLAHRERRRISRPDLVAGLCVEYRKLGRGVPAELGEGTPIEDGSEPAFPREAEALP